MNDTLQTTLTRLRRDRHKARRYTALLLVLAMLTSMTVSWNLHQIGLALTTDDEYYCGLTEHVHDESCYTRELVCGYEEGEVINPDAGFAVDAAPEAEAEPEPAEPEVQVHYHTDDCYEEVTTEETVLTCEQEEHTHTQYCYDDDGNLLCGYDEHTHDDSCYTTEEHTERKLICGYEEGEEIPVETQETENSAPVVFDDSSSLVVSEPEVHHHTDDCYAEVLTCGLEEHTHTAACLANPGADVEDEDDWEQYSENLSGFWNEALVKVAQEQLGYTESEKNFQFDEALGETLADAHRYTRYGAWYGNPYGEWDFMFVAFCQHYAGIPKTSIPRRAALDALLSDMDAMNFQYLVDGGEAAVPGDIVTYYNRDAVETIGIVEDAAEDTLTVISGDVDGQVAEVTVNWDDVTHTILVDKAYAAYTGESIPATLEGGEDEEWTVLAEDVSFDTTGALNLSSLSPAPTMKVTYFRDNVQYELTDGTELTEGDELSFDVDFHIPDGQFTEGGSTRAYYQLPVGFTKATFNAALYLEAADLGNPKIASIHVNEDGLVVIDFDPSVNGFDLYHAFSASFHVSGYATWNSDTEDSTVEFPGTSGTITITLKKNTDLAVEKALADDLRCDEDGKLYLLYTVTVSSQNGTHTGTVDLKDVISSTSTITGQYSHFELTSPDGSTQTVTPKVAEDNRSFTLEGLAPLKAGEQYVLTYRYYPDNAGPEITTSKTIQNTAYAKYDYNNADWTTSNEVTKTLYGVNIAKDASYGNLEQKLNKIKWVITVQNPEGRDLSGFLVTDAFQNKNYTIVGGVTINQSANGQNYSGFGSLPSAETNGQAGFTYTFPAGSTSKYYQFVYYSTPPVAGSTAVNYADIKQGETLVAQVTKTLPSSIGPRGWYVGKSANGTPTTANAGDTLVLPNWKLTIRSNQTAKEFTLVDAFQQPTGTDLDHYALLGELDDQLKSASGMEVYTSDPEAAYFNYTRATEKGIQIAFHYYRNRDCTDEIDATAANARDEKVRSFTVTFKWENFASYDVTQVNINGYKSYVDISSLPQGTTIKVPNRLTCNEVPKAVSTPEYTFTKPIVNSELKKLVALPTPRYFNNGNYLDIPYTDGQILWYKLWLKDPDPAKTSYTVTDLLPEGMEFDKFQYSYITVNENGGLAGGSYTNFTGCNTQGSGNVTYTLATAGSRQKITFTLNNLDTINPEHQSIAIIYTVKLSDADYWQYIDHTFKDYTNDAYWVEEEKPASATVHVTRESADHSVEKEALTNNETEQLDYVTYSLTINENGAYLLSRDSTLRLTDTFQIPEALSASLDFTRTHLYRADGVTEVPKDQWGLTANADDVTIENGQKNYTLELSVPDGEKFIFEYTYLIDSSSAAGERFVLNNSVSLAGYASHSVPNLVYSKVTAGGSARQNVAKLVLHKVDAEQNALDLAGAKFRLDKLEKGAWVEGTDAETYTTNTDGKIVFANNSTGDPDAVVDSDTLYRLVEVEAPAGYLLDATPQYFILQSENTSAADAYAKAVQSASDAEVPEQSSVKFSAYQRTETLQVSNTRKRITITKFWLDEAGIKDTGAHEAVTVNLYRRMDGGVADLVKAIKLDASNNWTYTYPQTGDIDLIEGAEYFVQEVAVSGYQTRYSNGGTITEDTGGAAVSIGDSVTVINQKKSTQLTVEKHWLSLDGTELTSGLPASVTVRLYQMQEDGTYAPEGQVLTLTAATQWKGTFTGLDSETLYYVVEDPVDFFEVSYRNSETGESGLVGVHPGAAIVVTNTQLPSYELPSTGGRGTAPYLAFGSALMAAAALLLARRKRKL